MEKHTFILPKPWLLFTFLTIASFSLLISSCKSNKKVDETQEASSKVFYMNCVKIDSAQIQIWVDNGWIKPADPKGKILLQFYSEDANKANKNMQLVAYPSVGYLGAIKNGEIITAINPACTPLKLDSKVIFGNNYFRIDSLHLFKPDGKLKSFDYLKIRPITGKDGIYLTFRARKIKLQNGKEVLLPDDEEEGSDPCPTFCPGDESN